MPKHPSAPAPLLLAGLLVLIMATAAWAIKISLFVDTDTFLARAKDIVIADVLDLPVDGGRGQDDGLYPVAINLVMTLKGQRPNGKATLATIYPVEKGHRYLVSSLGGSAYDTDLLAVPELSLVPVPADLKLQDLAGKSLKEQVALVFQHRLAEVEAAQKKLAEERSLLEKAVGRSEHHGLWAALTVPEPMVRTDRVENLQVYFALVNESDKPLDPKVDSWTLMVNGQRYADSAFLFGNGPRDQRWKSLPAGERLEFAYKVGGLFKTPDTYSISWKGAGFESAPVVFRVMAVPTQVFTPPSATVPAKP